VDVKTGARFRRVGQAPGGCAVFGLDDLLPISVIQLGPPVPKEDPREDFKKSRGSLNLKPGPAALALQKGGMPMHLSAQGTALGD
jgi:hypothetical protein